MNEQNDRQLAIYPGSFDPFTLGHLDIVRRASLIFGQLEVSVAVNAGKTSLFSVEERCQLIAECTRDLATVSVASFDGLLVDYAGSRDAVVLVRGLRQVSDFDFEFRMTFANRRLVPELETVFLMTSERHALISASIVREIYSWGGDISSFVPVPVREALESRRS